MDNRAEFGLTQLRVLGQRLRMLRRSRNLSLRKLANDSGVSVAAIQDLEGGNSSPSLLNVLSIAEVLGEPVDRLIAASMHPNSCPWYVRGRLIERSERRGQLLGQLSQPRMSGALLSIAAKGKLRDADRPTVVPMFAYVLDGEVELLFKAGRKERIATNDAVHIAYEAPRSWSNPFGKRALILCVGALAAVAEAPGATNA